MPLPGSAIPFKTGEGAKQTCPRCWGDGICPSWNGEGWPPICEGCGGRGRVSKKQEKAIIQLDLIPHHA